MAQELELLNADALVGRRIVRGRPGRPTLTDDAPGGADYSCAKCGFVLMKNVRLPTIDPRAALRCPVCHRFSDVVASVPRGR